MLGVVGHRQDLGRSIMRLGPGISSHRGGLSVATGRADALPDVERMLAATAARDVSLLVAHLTH
jgi:hypothetical protein